MIWWVLACAPQPSEAELFSRALLESDADAGFALCEGISGVSARSDCQLAVAENAGQPEACLRVESPALRGECFFVLAEGAAARQDRTAALEFCSLAGPYRNDCVQHLWDPPLRAKLRRADTPEKTLQLATQVYCQWEDLLAEDEEFQSRFWERAWVVMHSRSGALRLSRCASLPGDQQLRCERAAGVVLLRVLDQVPPSQALTQQVCSEGLPPWPELVGLEDPFLLELRDDRLKEICQAGGPTAESSARERTRQPLERSAVVQCRSR